MWKLLLWWLLLLVLVVVGHVTVRVVRKRRSRATKWVILAFMIGIVSLVSAGHVASRKLTGGGDYALTPAQVRLLTAVDWSDPTVLREMGFQLVSEQGGHFESGGDCEGRSFSIFVSDEAFPYAEEASHVAHRYADGTLSAAAWDMRTDWLDTSRLTDPRPLVYSRLSVRVGDRYIFVVDHYREGEASLFFGFLTHATAA